MKTNGLQTIGEFVASIDPNAFYVLEKHQNAAGYSTMLTAIADCDLSDVEQNRVIIEWSGESCAIMARTEADANALVILSRDAVFPKPEPQVEYPISNRCKIMAHAAEQAKLDDSWMQDCNSNCDEIADWARSFVEFEERAHLHFTDDLAAYTKLYARTYTYCYLQVAATRLKKLLDEIHGTQENQF